MTHQLKHAYTARLNRAIRTAQNIIVVLDGIKNKRRPIDSMADARGLLGHLSQEIHEASAYHSAWQSVDVSEKVVAEGKHPIGGRMASIRESAKNLYRPTGGERSEG